MWEELVMLENWEKIKTTYHISLCIAISVVRNTHVKRVVSRGLGKDEVRGSCGLTGASDLAVHTLNFPLGNAARLWSGLERAA